MRFKDKSFFPKLLLIMFLFLVGNILFVKQTHAINFTITVDKSYDYRDIQAVTWTYELRKNICTDWNLVRKEGGPANCGTVQTKTIAMADFATGGWGATGTTTFSYTGTAGYYMVHEVRKPGWGVAWDSVSMNSFYLDSVNKSINLNFKNNYHPPYCYGINVTQTADTVSRTWQFVRERWNGSTWIEDMPYTNSITVPAGGTNSSISRWCYGTAASATGSGTQHRFRLLTSTVGWTTSQSIQVVHWAQKYPDPTSGWADYTVNVGSVPLSAMNFYYKYEPYKPQEGGWIDELAENDANLTINLTKYTGPPPSLNFIDVCRPSKITPDKVNVTYETFNAASLAITPIYGAAALNGTVSISALEWPYNFRVTGLGGDIRDYTTPPIPLTWGCPSPPSSYTITPSADTGCTISPNIVENVASGGTSSTYTFSAQSGYTLLGYSKDGGATVAGSSSNFTNVTANHTIRAKCSLNTYTITPSADMGCTISPNVVENVASGGTSSLYTFSSLPGYVLLGYSKDGGATVAGTNANFTNVTTNHTISAKCRAPITFCDFHLNNSLIRAGESVTVQEQTGAYNDGLFPTTWHIEWGDGTPNSPNYSGLNPAEVSAGLIKHIYTSQPATNPKLIVDPIAGSSTLGCPFDIPITVKDPTDDTGGEVAP